MIYITLVCMRTVNAGNTDGLLTTAEYVNPNSNTKMVNVRKGYDTLQLPPPAPRTPPTTPVNARKVVVRNQGKTNILLPKPLTAEEIKIKQQEKQREIEIKQQEIKAKLNTKHEFENAINSLDLIGTGTLNDAEIKSKLYDVDNCVTYNSLSKEQIKTVLNGLFGLVKLQSFYQNIKIIPQELSDATMQRVLSVIHNIVIYKAQSNELSREQLVFIAQKLNNFILDYQNSRINGFNQDSPIIDQASEIIKDINAHLKSMV